MDKTIEEEFQTSIKDGITTGSLKFPNMYVSQIQLYSAVKEWSKEDKGLIYASIRVGGDDFIALDLRYDQDVNKKKYKHILYDFFKPLFEKKLGRDYIQAWSVTRGSVIIK